MHARPTIGRVVFTFLGFVVVGIPIVGYIWEVLSNILAGEARFGTTVLACVLLLFLLGLLRILARTVQRFDRDSSPPQRDQSV